MKRVVLGSIPAVLILALASLAVAGDQQALVLTDGAKIPVISMTLKGAVVDIELPNGLHQQYETDWVDLEASGLVEKAAEVAEVPGEPAPPKGKFSGAIASGTGDPGGVMITDQDVDHVKPAAAGARGEAEEEPATPASLASLMVSDLQRELVGSVMKVSGKVFNTGETAVTAISITAEAQTADGGTSGKGTTGLSQTLEPGASADFSVAVPVEGEATNVRVTAMAALSDFKFEEVAAPETAEGEAEGQ